MGLKENLKEKVPAEIKKRPEYKTLLSLVEKENLKDMKALNAHFDREIRKYRRLLYNAERQENTSNRHRVKYASWIDTLKDMKAIAEKAK